MTSWRILLIFVTSIIIFMGDMTHQSAIADAPVLSPAERFLQYLAKGQTSEAGKMLNSKMRQAVTDKQLASIWQEILLKTGTFDKQIKIENSKTQMVQVVVITCQMSRATLAMRIAQDTDGNIAGLFIDSITPYQEIPPVYVKPELFQEKNVTINTGKWALPGTLTLPKCGKLCPGIVLIQGSGPNDRDETIGPNKPFRNLAQGLASRGIAVLRYDKRTLTYNELYKSDKKMLMALTPQDEVIDDALSAVKLLHTTEQVDPKQICVLGHSLGAMLLPRMVQQDKDHDIAQIILLAGPARPLEDVIIGQYQYIASISKESDVNLEVQLKKLQKDALKIKELRSESMKIDNPEILLGVSSVYWLDLLGYNPVATAARLNIPMLILQGERDYQVTQQDFQAWQTGLKNNPKVLFHQYSKLNHIFMAGMGPITPAEYQNAGYVDEQVISDISQWVMTNK